MIKMLKLVFTSLIFIGLTTRVNYAHEQPEYPTYVLADYVFACMAVNGQRYDILQKCSCSIDYIAERLAYSDYEKAETIMQIQQDKGQRGIFYRETNWANHKVDLLKKLQAESTLVCF